MTTEHALENLRHGVDIATIDGHDVGKLHAIVVDPADNQVTHLAVNTGPHFPEPGFGDPRIVSVDMDRVGEITDSRIVLALSDAEFAALPLYGHTHFFDVPDSEQTPDAPGVSRLWNVASAVAAALAQLGSGIAIPAEHVQKASFERHILNDAPVWRSEPHTHIGDVERVLIDDTTDEIAALVIKRGVVFTEDVVLPIRYVTEIRDGVIRAQISDEEIEALEEFGG